MSGVRAQEVILASFAHILIELDCCTGLRSWKVSGFMFDRDERRGESEDLLCKTVRVHFMVCVDETEVMAYGRKEGLSDVVSRSWASMWVHGNGGTCVCEPTNEPWEGRHFEEHDLYAFSGQGRSGVASRRATSDDEDLGMLHKVEKRCCEMQRRKRQTADYVQDKICHMRSSSRGLRP